MVAYKADDSREERQRLRSVEFPDEEVFKIRKYTKRELANLYGISIKTLNNWINRHEQRFSQLGYYRNIRLLDPAMVRLFVEIFDTP